jgi:3-dehydroquinate synthase
MPDPIIVSHVLGKYPVYVESGILQRMEDVIRGHLAHRRVALIADESVLELYQIGRFGRSSWTGETLTVAPGEGSKSRESWARLTDELLTRRFGRDSGLVGLGGGVVGDLTGFVAATYMRGLPYLLAPTTLLAMVDASVGGKTGVNTAYGKNLIGAFHPPVAVLADPLTLLTLPGAEYCSGLAEAVKHGLTADQEYFEWIESHVAAILQREPAVVTQLVRRSVEIKAEVVSQDERETGRRAILNAGHTVAHALERASGYELPHGHAVGLGLLVECAIAERLGVAPRDLRPRLHELLVSLGLPSRVTGATNRDLVLASMTSDKKNRNSAIHFALPSGVGSMHSTNGWTIAVSPETVRDALTLVE